MAETLVQCPSCQAKMKLTSAVEKVRCPRCDTLFVASNCRVKSQPAKRKPTSSTKKRAASNVYDLAEDNFDTDDGDDLFGGVSSRKPRRKKSRQPSQRPRPRRQPKPGTIEPDQLRKFAFTIMAFGIGAFVLPLIGLQIKGLHAMTPEMQSLGGVFFLMIGVVLLLISYKDHFGSTVQGGMKLVKWGAIGLAVFLVGGTMLMIMKNVVVGALGEGNDAAEHERIVQEMHDKIPIPEMPVPPAQNTPSLTPSTISPMVTTSDKLPTDPTSPFQDITPAFKPSSSNPEPSTQNTTRTNPTGHPPGFQPRFRGGPGRMNRPIGTAPSGETVNVILKGFPRGDVVRHLRDLRAAARTPRMRMVKLDDNFANVSFDRVDNAQAFADRIKFGTVTSVDVEKKEITLEP